jgi:sigma-B regulation protein RsbU (phosphoserine phosphatase)
VTVHAEFRPAQEVGGDYFDVFAVGDDRLLVTIGDVAGHGLPTGLLMAALKSSVAALIHEGYSGADLLSKVGSLLQRQAQRRTMVTMAVVDIDLVHHTVSLASAGHPPPFLVTPAGQVIELLAGSLPLGSPLCRPATLEREFAPGSRLLAYTDGLVEGADRDGEPLGYAALSSLLGEAASLDAAALVRVLIEAFDRHTQGRALSDDLTLLVLEYGQESRRA